LSTYYLTQTGGTISGTDVLILPYGSVTWLVSGQTAANVNSLKVYNPNPATTDFGARDQEDDFTLSVPSCSVANVTVTSRNGSGFLGGAGASGSDTTTWSRTPASIQITSADIVGYTINVTLTGGATNTLTVTLNGITNGAINPFAVMPSQESQGPG
jgi:hypothetical protein